LIRKYGETWFEKLEQAAKDLKWQTYIKCWLIELYTHIFESEETSISIVINISSNQKRGYQQLVWIIFPEIGIF
jgi:hypothetical protein